MIFFIVKGLLFLFKILSKTLFCNEDHHQTLFVLVFAGGTNKEKFKFSYKNYGSTPLEKWDFSDIKLSFLWSKKPFFYLQHHKALFVVVFSSKTSKEKFEFLGQNHGLIPLEKYNFLYFEKLLISWSQIFIYI